jgi:hypothetical protein
VKVEEELQADTDHDYGFIDEYLEESHQQFQFV